MGDLVFRIEYADRSVELRALAIGRYHIGREQGDIVFRGDPSVSARHARLDVQSGSVWITDLGSTNGIFLASGSRLTAPHSLQFNEAVRVGHSTLTLMLANSDLGRTKPMPQVAPAPLETNGGACAAAPLSDRKRDLRAQYEECRREHARWKRRVGCVGTGLALSTLAFLGLLVAGGGAPFESPTTILSGAVALVSEGGVMQWLVKRRRDAGKEERFAFACFVDPSLLSSALKDDTRGGRSLWQSFRLLPLPIQLIALIFAWWLLIPIWLWDCCQSAALKSD